MANFYYLKTISIKIKYGDGEWRQLQKYFSFQNKIK